MHAHTHARNTFPLWWQKQPCFELAQQQGLQSCPVLSAGLAAKPRLGHLGHLGQCLREWRLLSISGQPLPTFSCPRCQNFFLRVRLEFPLMQLVTFLFSCAPLKKFCLHLLYKLQLGRNQEDPSHPSSGWTSLALSISSQILCASAHDHLCGSPQFVKAFLVQGNLKQDMVILAPLNNRHQFQGCISRLHWGSSIKVLDGCKH